MSSYGPIRLVMQLYPRENNIKENIYIYEEDYNIIYFIASRLTSSA